MKKVLIANRGEIAEGILGAAMFAKFTKRAPSAEIAQVTTQDIERILAQLNPKEKDIYSVTVEDADNKHADTITFDLFLKTTPILGWKFLLANAKLFSRI